MISDKDLEYVQEVVERVNKSLEGTGCSVTMEDIIALNDKFNAWDDMREHMQGGKNPVQKKRPVQAGRKVQSAKVSNYPNVGVNELRLGMTHDEVQEILGTSESKPFRSNPEVLEFMCGEMPADNHCDCKDINMANDLDMEYIQQTAERVNKSLEGTGRSVTIEDIIVLHDWLLASGWNLSLLSIENIIALTGAASFRDRDDILADIMTGGKISAQKAAAAALLEQIPPPELIIYPNVGINELRLGMTHDEVQEILGIPESVSKPSNGASLVEDYCWNGSPSWIFRLTFSDDRLSEILLCLDETRDQKISVKLCGVEISDAHPEDIVPQLLKFSVCYYETYPKSKEIYEKYRVTPREQSLYYLFDGLGVSFSRFTDFHPNYLGTDYFDDWVPEVIEDEKAHWNMETVSLSAAEEMERLRDYYNSRDEKTGDHPF